jgi:hypothetical protein
MSDSEDFSDADSDVPEHFQDDHYHNDSESDNYYSDDEDVVYTDYLFVSRLCAQLRNNDPSVLPEGPNQYFEPCVLDWSRLNIAEALAQNTIIRRIGLELQHYTKLSADAMAKYPAQSKHLLAVKLSLDVRFETGEECPHHQFLSSFIDAIGQSNSVEEINLTCPGLGPASSKSFENMLTRTKTLQLINVDLKSGGLLEEAATAAIASGFSKNSF